MLHITHHLHAIWRQSGPKRTKNSRLCANQSDRSSDNTSATHAIGLFRADPLEIARRLTLSRPSGSGEIRCRL
jgi:hypothetical protein